MAKQKWANCGRKLNVKEMISLAGIYRAGECENVLRLWRSWQGLTQDKMGQAFGVPGSTIGALERWGLKGFEGKYGESVYAERLEKFLGGLGELGVTPEMLGLQYEGRVTRFSKPIAQAEGKSRFVVDSVECDEGE